MYDSSVGRTVESASTTLDVLDALVELDGARVTEVAEHLDVSKSTASNHLHTLQQKTYVTADGDEYYPSLKTTHLGEYAKRRKRAYEHAAEVTHNLDQEIPFETTFMIEENGIGRYLVSEVSDPSRHDKFAFAGQEEHLHAIAAGKTILTSFPRERVEKIIQQWGLPKKTENTITSRDELFAELARVREQGYSVNRQENREEIYAIAKAAYEPSGIVLGAMSVITPFFRLKGEDFDKDIYQLLFSHIEELEQRLESSASSGP